MPNRGFSTLTTVGLTRFFAPSSRHERLFVCRPGRGTKSLLLDPAGFGISDGSLVKSVAGRFVEVWEYGYVPAGADTTKIVLMDARSLTVAPLANFVSSGGGGDTPVYSSDGYVAFLREPASPDGSSQAAQRTVVAYGPDGSRVVLDPQPGAHDLTVSANTAQWFTGDDPTPRTATLTTRPTFRPFPRAANVTAHDLAALPRRETRPSRR